MPRSSSSSSGVGSSSSGVGFFGLLTLLQLRSSERCVMNAVSRYGRILARRADGAEACVVLANPPSAEDVRRLVALAAMPGLVDATWTAAPGTSSR